MTDLNQGPAGLPSPFGVPPQPLPGQPFNPPQEFYAPAPPPQNSAPPQYSAGQYSAGSTGSLSAESQSPLIALICGILSWCGFSWITAIPAIIFGVKGRREAREGRTRKGGMATAGLWLGVTNVVIGTFAFLFILAIAIPAFHTQRAKGVDVVLKSDLKAMAMLQEAYVINNPGEMGVEVAATSPGGTATADGDTLTTHPGNVIAVKVGPEGFCVSAYNSGASLAKSPTASMLYRSESGGLQPGVGVC